LRRCSISCAISDVPLKVPSALKPVVAEAAGLRRLIDRGGIRTVDELGPGTVRGIGAWAVLNVNGERYAVSRRCRHLRADLANGKIDEDRCLVCPWHRSRYDTTTGRMVVGPQAGFEKVPGLDTAFIQLTKLWRLRRAEVVERDGNVYVRT
jgi:nitrite reductase/ring-hydroxylating ferredoxin subunit